MDSHNTVINLTYFTNFPASIFLIGFRKTICISLFLNSQEPQSRSIWKANDCIFLYISVTKCLFQRFRKLLFGEKPDNLFQRCRKLLFGGKPDNLFQRCRKLLFGAKPGNLHIRGSLFGPRNMF